MVGLVGWGFIGGEKKFNSEAGAIEPTQAALLEWETFVLRIKAETATAVQNRASLILAAVAIHLSCSRHSRYRVWSRSSV